MTKRSLHKALFLVPLLLGIAARLAFAGDYPPSHMAVFPRDAEHLKPVELSELIADVVPAKGFRDIGWGYLSDAPIVWVTNGFEDDGGTETTRWGLVRIRINGTHSTILRQRKEELAWSVTLATDGGAQFGPTFIRIEPGFDNARELGIDDSQGQPGVCFGTLFARCDFTIQEALASPRIAAHQVCAGRFNTSPDVYEIHIAGKQPALLAYSSAGGSGGTSSNIEIHSLGDKGGLCSPHYPR